MKSGLDQSACGQAVYYVLTGEEPPAEMSTQTAFFSSIFSVLIDDNIYRNSLRNAIFISGLSVDGFNRGKQFVEKNQNELSKTLSKQRVK